MPLKPVFAAALLGLVLAGCATVEGIGRDISGGAQRASNWF
ncbi:entericidin EcnA/B family protein [Litorivita pollutaquae]|uniref:Entericidin EcnA/B family protein n=1 Tax=Litorivita pollutaquae TaxID=2200892 RepID=A0A2V4MVI8_9RHOB|nr:entericidin EcnA/B family protein [Litorivita pollutaquae]PYC48328.1 entericidin EcnA/B family protein [Litorivita pollutaquae]